MYGLDRLFAGSVESVLQEFAGKTSISKIEKRLNEKYDLSIRDAAEQFHKLDSVLREIFGAGADALEENILKRFIEVAKKSPQKLDNDVFQTITIKEQNTAQLIAQMYAEPDKNKLLDAFNEEPKIIQDALEQSKVPQTSGYRKVNSLIDAGLLIPDGYGSATDGKRVNKYRALFDNISINIGKNKMNVQSKIRLKDLKESELLQVIS
ncbi:transcriptional regulator [Nitrosopumilus sp.]|uniref:transcriptional regulator n=1 Tax=Nitrosopumilus sp. TaxID=2024843 RepID=UPI00292F0DCC|nr:transcriptional regulator [Nitrosopumilus sp.]